MAKIKTYEDLGNFGTIWLDYNSTEMHTDMDSSGGDKAVYIDAEGGGRIILLGENFAYLDGELLKGRVDKVIFQDSEGNQTARVDGLDLKAKLLNAMLTEDDGSGTYSFVSKVFGGDDTYTGSAIGDLAWAGKGDDLIKGFGGIDSINGEKGDDVMIGGDDADIFFFMYGGGGRDVITDFDANGDDQDHIQGHLEDVVSMKQKGDDLVLNYGDGNTLTLLDVHKSEITEDDFIITI